MQWLAGLQHHIVGNVHHHVDATQSAALQPADQPIGCGRVEIDIAHHSAAIERARIRAHAHLSPGPRRSAPQRV